jgi:hypothetical protein
MMTVAGMLADCAVGPRSGEPPFVFVQVMWNDGATTVPSGDAYEFFVNGDKIIVTDGMLQDIASSNPDISSSNAETTETLKSILFYADRPGERRCSRKSHTTPYGPGGFIGQYEVCATYLGKNGSIMFFDFSKRLMSPVMEGAEITIQTKISVDTTIVPCRAHLIYAQRTYTDRPEAMEPITRVLKETCDYIVRK